MILLFLRFDNRRDHTKKTPAKQVLWKRYLFHLKPLHVVFYLILGQIDFAVMIVRHYPLNGFLTETFCFRC